MCSFSYCCSECKATQLGHYYCKTKCKATQLGVTICKTKFYNACYIIAVFE